MTDTKSTFEKSLIEMTDGELNEFVAGRGMPKFRAAQIREWLWRGAPDMKSMTNLPAQLRDLDVKTLPLKLIKTPESDDGQTVKFLFELSDGEKIESVLMRTTYGNSVCVSSQAGCAMGCAFCASTMLGLRRNLTTNEMNAQVLFAQWHTRQLVSSKEKVVSKKNTSSLLLTTSYLKPNGDPNHGDISHIVIMGTGEPMLNLENTIGFMTDMNTHLGISWRRMTVSTCGIVPGIDALAGWGRPVNLAISLHAPTDDLRTRLMPINTKYNIENTLDAAFKMSDKSGRQLMIEYLLIAGLNDQSEHAKKLAELLHGKNVLVNIIPWNTVAEKTEFFAPSNNAVHRFADELKRLGIHTRIRRERGADVGAACGQLRISDKSD
ncbi:MAG: 23S rRNA (adenine(2503)-C(2))-methyltransferase RlmN [Rickettsiales bacterium]|jgi:23S rRNA (adenine2503-C2)-methyltransferase|nr:23S rRNA (adenine(2503)-C(2))-methyltransferase RlmN [Rickettsiales bacterium]